MNHSVNDKYMGTVLRNGILGHLWFDGTWMPVLSGSAEDGDAGGDEGEGDDGGESDDDDDDDTAKGKKKAKGKDDDDEDDKEDWENASPASIKRAFRQATDRRIKIKALNDTVTAKDAELATANAKIADLEKNGTGDPKLKEQLSERDKTIDKLTKENADLKTSVAEGSINKQLEEAIAEFKLTDTVKRVRGILQADDSLEVDDGEIVNLSRSIKRLIKSGELRAKKVSSGDENTGDESGASRSSGSPMRRGNSVRTVSNEEALKKKYPALSGR